MAGNNIIGEVQILRAMLHTTNLGVAHATCDAGTGIISHGNMQEMLVLTSKG
jgi:hypothetical protein